MSSSECIGCFFTSFSLLFLMANMTTTANTMRAMTPPATERPMTSPSFVTSSTTSPPFWAAFAASSAYFFSIYFWIRTLSPQVELFIQSSPSSHMFHTTLSVESWQVSPLVRFKLLQVNESAMQLPLQHFKGSEHSFSSLHDKSNLPSLSFLIVSWTSFTLTQLFMSVIQKPVSRQHFYG